MSGELEMLAGATKALAEVSSASGAWELARTAEAARRYAQMKGLGHEAVNYATGIKAKAMVLLAEFVDEGQAKGTVRTQGRPENVSDDNVYSLPELLGEKDANRARQAVHQARSLRDSLAGQDIDKLVREANDSREDLGIRGLRIMASRQREPEPVPGPVPFPDGRFSCIVIDPPWPVQKIETWRRPDQGSRLDYPVMTLDDIAKLPVTEKSADDCHIYLWVTHKYLPTGLGLLEAWGFRYQCVMTWWKHTGVSPYSWMYDTEHVLFGHRGNLPLAQMGLRLFFDAPNVRHGHSTKPDVFYERVIAASPGPRLEMFARAKREGFTAWGNEVPNAE